MDVARANFWIALVRRKTDCAIGEICKDVLGYLWKKGLYKPVEILQQHAAEVCLHLKQLSTPETQFRAVNFWPHIFSAYLELEQQQLWGRCFVWDVGHPCNEHIKWLLLERAQMSPNSTCKFMLCDDLNTIDSVFSNVAVDVMDPYACSGSC